MHHSDTIGERIEAGLPQHYCLFESAMGACGIAWSERGVTRFQLPERDWDATERRLQARAGNARRTEPTATIAPVIALVQDHMCGQRSDFTAVVLDLNEVEPTFQQIYAAARTVGWGRTTTYGELAHRVGTSDARIVGQAMARNPAALIIPCHRVLASGNKLGGFSAYGGVSAKERLLSLEGVRVGSETPPLLRLLEQDRRESALYRGQPERPTGRTSS